MHRARDQSAGDLPTEVMPSGTMLAPGFIDLQVNGGGGILLNNEPTPDAMRAIARAHRNVSTILRQSHFVFRLERLAGGLAD